MQALLPGVFIAALVATAATLIPPAMAGMPGLAGRLPLSPILVAILLGLALSGVAQRRPGWSIGLWFASRRLLELAVMLIGLRLSLAAVGTLGMQALPLVAAMIVVGLALTLLLGRFARIPARLTALLAVGSAICGASAIAAAAPAMRARPEETAYALACITLFGLLATLSYPWLLGMWPGDGLRAGLVMGAAIHDTAQVTAAALLFEQTFADPGVLAAATVTKLIRNLAMLVVIPLVVGWALRGTVDGAGSRPALPLFILGFLVLAGVRSGGDALFGDADTWMRCLEYAAAASAFLFAMAMAAIGMEIRLAALRRLGWRPAAVALATALGMAAVALALVSLLG
jgi:uncharacterized integral membrane protein (TIGR00698 family)